LVLGRRPACAGISLHEALFFFSFFKGVDWLRVADLYCNVSDVSSNINEW